MDDRRAPDVTETRIEYAIYHNLDAGFARIYRHGDRLADGHRGTIDVLDGFRGLAEAVFVRHNRDDRPDGCVAPALSIGDVVVLGETALSVDRVGFAPVRVDPGDLLGRSWADCIAG